MKGHPFKARLGYAMAGLRAAWRSEKSLRTHAVATVLIVVLLVLTRAPALWWAVMAIGLSKDVAAVEHMATVHWRMTATD
jgi:undecaprenol kinase